MAESFILCGHQAFKNHIKGIAVFIHKDDRMEVAQGQFSNREGEGDLTRLESGKSFSCEGIYVHEGEAEASQGSDMCQ